MTRPPLRIGTRRSPLALAQTRLVAAALTAASGRRTELVPISTVGDADQQTPLQLLGGTGVFVTALRQALLQDKVDLAVHSYKDLPTAAFPGLTIAAVPEREDVRDALVSRDRRRLAELQPGARIGTGSPRRAAQLHLLRDDVTVTGLRGNLDTRLRKVADGTLDAVVLACAGLHRLRRGAVISEAFDVDVMLPAPAQGALAVESRADRPDIVALAAAVEQPAVRTSVDAERRLLARLEAGCSAPVGAAAHVSDNRMSLTGAVFDIDGARQIRATVTGDTTETLDVADRLAEELFRRGAAQLLAEDHNGARAAAQ